MSIERWQSVIDEALQKALENGELSNLPGAGKPLNLRRDSFVPDDMQMAYKIMRDNEIAPDWVMMGKELTQQENKLRDHIRAAVRTYQTALAESERAVPGQVAAYRQNAEAQWQAAQRSIQALADQYNDRVLTYNLKVPPGIPHRRRFDFALEIAQARK